MKMMQDCSLIAVVDAERNGQYYYRAFRRRFNDINSTCTFIIRSVEAHGVPTMTKSKPSVSTRGHIHKAPMENVGTLTE